MLRAGSNLVYHRLPWREPDATYMLQVLYENDEMIALNKPSGLQVLPGGFFQQQTVLTLLRRWASKQASSLASQEFHPVPVHRLGRGTSADLLGLCIGFNDVIRKMMDIPSNVYGLIRSQFYFGILLCAKSKLAKTHLAAYFVDGTSLIRDNSDTGMVIIKRRKISKIYRALVDGIVTLDKVTIMQPIGTVRYSGVAKGLYVASPSGKPALSRVEVLDRDVQRNRTLVQVEIESGRPHQIRIHLSFIGHPLLGDPLYEIGGQPKCFDSEFVDESFAQDGGYQRPTKPVPGDCGYYLHANRLSLLHPTTNEVVRIAAPLLSILQTRVEDQSEKATMQ